MPNQERRRTRAQIEARRWLIGTAISVVGVVIAALALWPSAPTPRTVLVVPETINNSSEGYDSGIQPVPYRVLEKRTPQNLVIAKDDHKSADEIICGLTGECDPVTDPARHSQEEKKLGFTLKNKNTPPLNKNAARLSYSIPLLKEERELIISNILSREFNDNDKSSLVRDTNDVNIVRARIKRSEALNKSEDEELLRLRSE